MYFSVEVLRRRVVTDSVTIEVEAESEESAKAAALVRAHREESKLRWSRESSVTADMTTSQVERTDHFSEDY